MGNIFILIKCGFIGFMQSYKNNTLIVIFLIEIIIWTEYYIVITKMNNWTFN